MIDKLWYSNNPLYWLLLPFSWLYGAIVTLRRYCYHCGLLASWRAPVPVVIVGNLTVGGNGKTPLVIWLVQQLRQQQYRVAVISRGYGGRAASYPWRVDENTTAEIVGDEPLLIWQRTGVPVAVGADRRAAIEMLLAEQPLDVIISDDGLQHYALQRDVEWVVMDAVRRFGNGWWLPAGPMRERTGRLQQVDALVINGHPADYLTALSDDKQTRMQLVAHYAVNLLTGEQKNVSELPACVAMAGIGYPGRFFTTLKQLGVPLQQTIAFADHQHYSAEQLQQLATEEQLLIMTEKDAVKCRPFAQPNWWYLPVTAVFSATDQQRLLQTIRLKIATFSPKQFSL